MNENEFNNCVKLNEWLVQILHGLKLQCIYNSNLILPWNNNLLIYLQYPTLHIYLDCKID